MEKAPFLFISKGVKGGRLEIHFGTFWKKTAKTDNFMLLIADYIPAKKEKSRHFWSTGFHHAIEEVNRHRLLWPVSYVL